MIESKDNEKLKLVRKLRERKHREREGLFATEGEDLLEAGLAAGAEPRFVLVAPRARSTSGSPDETPSTSGSSDGAPSTSGSSDEARSTSGSPDEARSTLVPLSETKDDRVGRGVAFDEVAPELLDSVSSLGSGTRVIAVWPLVRAAAPAAPCVYLDGVGDPGNVGTIIRSAHALLDATVALGPDCADPYGPKATRASMGSLFGRPPALVAGVEETPRPRVALVAHGGAGLEALAGAGTVCLGAERQGLRPEVVAACDAGVTIPLHGGAESLNVAAAAAVACARMSEERTSA
ncbi:MAG TPA: RNA methyltransferase [Solirubrobacterales bacterium]|nr:RNA methyltransferase [Solirubrobacterales bacterium]